MIDKTETDPVKYEKLDVGLPRFVGYILLAFSLVDFINIFVPIKLMNPAWELETIQGLVGQVAAPMLGLVLVFYKQLEFRVKKEIFWLRQLSWISLAVGILYFLLIPILIVSNIHLDAQLNEQVTTQIDERTASIGGIEQQLTKANSEKDLQTLFKKLTGQELPPELQKKSANELKATLSQRLSKTKASIRPQVEAIAQDSRFPLIKKMIKLLVGLVISGTAFIYIWYLTRWVRKPKAN